MSKRGATSELNDRNWDVEEEAEEAGKFTQATTDVLQSRVIKRAKRRGTQEEGGDGRKAAVFGGFGGLSTSKPFGSPGFTKSATIGSGISFGGLGGGKTTTSSSMAPTFGAAAKVPSLGSAFPLNGSSEEGKKPPQGRGDSDDSAAASYFHALKTLNVNVLAWIKQHVEENPYIFLTPIFKDYQTHLDAIEAKRGEAGVPPAPSSTFTTGPSFTSSVEKSGLKAAAESSNASSGEAAPFSSSSPAKAESCDAGNAKAEDSKATQAKPFTFGLTSSQTEAKPASFGGLSSSNGGFKFSTSSSSSPGFNFGASTKSDGGATTSLGATSGFSFGGTSASGGSSALFGASSTSSTQGSSQQKDDEEYEPPKVEVKEIKEDDALYSKRCKLYYQRDGQWVDRGVGNVHLKPVGDTKTQLLVRADTNLGNILLNIMLSGSLPISRQGKNNVFMACVPNPPLSSKPDEAEADTPVPMLIRVKTAEDADELKSKIDERLKLLS